MIALIASNSHPGFFLDLADITVDIQEVNMPTQRQIGDDLGLSQSTISNLFDALGLAQAERDALSLEDARHLIVKHYKDLANGRGGFDLARERARESRLKGDLLQLQIQEKAGTLIPADAVEREWQSLIVAARSELLLLPGKIAHEVKSLYGIEIDPSLIEDHVRAALNRLANEES